MTDPFSVLFVCTANVSRSPYLERRSAQLSKAQGVTFQSAGTHDFSGREMYSFMERELSARGGSAQGHLSRHLTRAIARSADLILTAERGHREFIVDEWPALTPRTFTVSQFAQALASVPQETSRAELVRAAYVQRGPARSSGNILDPYKLGAEASKIAADHIDTLLAQILPRF